MKGFSHTGKDSVSKLLSDVDPLNGKSFKAERDFKKLLNTFMFNSVELFIAAILCFHMTFSYFSTVPVPISYLNEYSYIGKSHTVPAWIGYVPSTKSCLCGTK